MKRSVLILGIIVLVLSVAWAASPPVFEKAKGIALSGKQSSENPSCYFWEKHVAKDSIDFIFVIGYCKSDRSMLMAIVEGPKTILMLFNDQEFTIYLLLFNQVIDAMPLSEKQAVEFAEFFFRELASYEIV